MDIRQLVNRIIKTVSISLVVSFILLLPIRAFAQGGLKHSTVIGGSQGGDNQGENNQGGTDMGNQGGDQGSGSNGGVDVGVSAGETHPVDSAPEINLASINAAMGLLVGGAMWLRHRK